MGNEISSYDVDPIISGNEIVIGSNDNGETANYSIKDIAAYAQTDGTGRMSLFDGATDSAAYNETFANSDGALDFPARLGLSGPLTDNDYFPSKYGDIISNQLSAPASSSFDFRFMGLGLFIEFDVEFNVRLADDLNNRVSSALILYYEVTFPNGDVQTRQFNIQNDYIVTTTTSVRYVKFTFSTYIKDVLTDSLLGGSMRFYTNDAVNGTDILTIRDLTVRARI